jgi:hypothetical protein
MAGSTAKETVEERGNVDLNIRGMSPELRQQFKVLCAQKSVTMTEGVLSLIEGAVAGKIPVPFDGRPLLTGSRS